MGMVMYVRAVSAEELDALLGDDGALFAWVSDEASWEADKMWWAALDLLLGPGGVEQLDGDPITEAGGHGPVMRMSSSAVARLAAAVADADPSTVTERFDAGAFGDPLGPEVTPDDRDWLVSAAMRLAGLLREADGASRDLVWVVT